MKQEGITVVLSLMLIFSHALLSTAQDAEKPVPPSRNYWLYVGGTGPGNYTGIQDAIDNASNGDTVFVFSGTYIGHININKSITLMGEDKNTTYITGFVAYTISIISDWVQMRGFTIQNGGRLGEGVRIDSCFNTFSDNIINTPKDDVRLFGDNNKFSGNIIIANILYLSGDSNVISRNSITNFYYGIYLTDAWSNSISNNSFFNCGLFFSDDTVTDNIVANNTVNNKPLVYIDGKSNMVVDGDAGQIICVNCTNITVENQETSNTTVGIQIIGSTQCRILDNLITGNRYGLCHYGEDNIVTNNTFTDNSYGILLSGDRNTVSWNTITKNNVGMYLDYSTCNNTIAENILAQNTYGMQLDYGSDFNTIIHNSIVNNSYGIRLGSTGNRIYHNNLLHNTQNAYDSSLNMWCDAEVHQGNYWSDYTGNDLNNDGIGDTIYTIPGGASQDSYPLMYPYGNTSLVVRCVPYVFNSKLLVKNSGATTAFTVHWALYLDGGFLFCKRDFSGMVKPVLPGEEITISLEFFFFGFGSIRLQSSAWAENAPVSIATMKGGLIFFIFFTR